MTLACEIVLTRSGARAMLDHTTGEVMHPVVGPLVEARRLYVQPARLLERLSEPSPSALVLLDVGLGAGSNAAAAYELAAALPVGARQLSLVSFDRSLSALQLALSPENAAAFGLEGGAGQAARALLARRSYSGARCLWRYVEGDLTSTLVSEPEASADVVFWDPFSLRANPGLWTFSTFAALRRICRAGATVHTYSGATQIRAALLLAGFGVGLGEKISEGKYGTYAAVSPAVPALPLDRRWLERLSRSSAPFPPDAPPDALERIRGLPQFAA
jgi:queuine tRNA-ribosyltransferase